MEIWHIVILLIGAFLYWYGSKRLKKIEEERMSTDKHDQLKTKDHDPKGSPISDKENQN